MIGSPISQDGQISQEGRQLWITFCEHADQDLQTSRQTSDLRGKRCAICNQFWMFNGPDWLNHTRTPEPMARDVHKTCYGAHRAIVDLGEWYRLMLASPFLFDTFDELPNQYGGWGTPWYRIHLVIKDKDQPPDKHDEISPKRLCYPSLILGWRKRVAHMELKIDASHTGGPLTKKDVEGLWIETIDNTKHIHDESLMVHAWPDRTNSQLDAALLSFAEVIRRRFPTAAFRRPFGAV